MSASPVEALLRGWIAQRGPLSFRDVMEAALYHPRYGYYATLGGFGAQGDFITSPETHPLFGALLARQVEDAWQALGEPRPFRVLEYGGGSGALAAALLDWLRTERSPLAEALEYAIDERSPSLRALQEQALYDRGVRWGAPAAPVHVVLANEVLDAFPAHRVVVRDGRLRELRVGLAGEDGPFVWVEADGAPPEVEAYFARLDLLPPEGGVAEVCTGARAWVREVADRLARRGLALVLDYGAPAADLFARPQGTLLTYYRHTMGSDPLVRVGRQDISVHVDFTTLAAAAQEAGLEVLGLTSQRDLLRALGVEALVPRLRAPEDRAAVARLLAPDGLGRIRALFLGRGLAGYHPVGLAGGRTWPPPAAVPALPPEPPPEEFMLHWREAFGSGD